MLHPDGESQTYRTITSSEVDSSSSGSLSVIVESLDHESTYEEASDVNGEVPPHTHPSSGASEIFCEPPPYRQEKTDFARNRVSILDLVDPKIELGDSIFTYASERNSHRIFSPNSIPPQKMWSSPCPLASLCCVQGSIRTLLDRLSSEHRKLWTFETIVTIPKHATNLSEDLRNIHDQRSFESVISPNSAPSVCSDPYSTTLSPVAQTPPNFYTNPLSELLDFPGRKNGRVLFSQLTAGKSKELVSF